MKHKLLTASLTILSTSTLMACSHTTQKDTAASSTKESSSKVEKQTSSSSSKDTASTKKTTPSQETKRIGNADYGYIDIPSKWFKFTDIDGTEAVQYTDGSGYNIVTLNSYTKEKAKVPADIEFNAEFLAKKLAVMWQDNQDVGKMTGARTKVSGLDAYQLQIVMKSGQYLITWIFQKGEKVYTISFEGDAETLKTFIPYIENTWSLDGTGAVTD
ncbi:hypothetical protein [Streptococcus sp. HMSC057G03]|uniref:hypothetical protein n=1 Tax=Streptococcus sp. HMSC057G03 TaxID=1715165 RepID=UPI0008A65D4B|nr:hypothetical protein [Streptococcus sp. HMSC057G03]MDU3000568.1 hypothetical protein [Streptococcus parasanguinis]MDU4887431.1 hypothetical protein [Streptococcus parasanguinis]OFN90025.1 hypothetical protein HMPREF2686_02040 [Streptococcus sp. HMSC057G03]